MSRRDDQALAAVVAWDQRPAALAFEARRKSEAWPIDDNEVHPRNAIGNQVPAMLHRSAGNPRHAAAR
jgi:hypothetical protein